MRRERLRPEVDREGVGPNTSSLSKDILLLVMTIITGMAGGKSDGGARPTMLARAPPSYLLRMALAMQDGAGQAVQVVHWKLMRLAMQGEIALLQVLTRWRLKSSTSRFLETGTCNTQEHRGARVIRE